MAIDLQYLYWLQGLREASGNIFTPFMTWVSDFATNGVILVPAFVFWCIHKRSGTFLLLSMGISKFINGVAKLTVCAYRPWIRDARIVPTEEAIATAGGYSFPSGHTMDSSPIYGGLAVLTRKKAMWFACLCGVMIILTALSRNYLGVHTPQDVVVGSLLGLCSVYLAAKVLNVWENHGGLVMICGFALCIAAIVYFSVKSYPMDYVDGKLVVDPAKMVRSGYTGVGGLAGVLVGMFLDKTCIHHEETGFNAAGVVLSLIGVAICYYCDPIVKSLASNLLGQSWGRFANRFILMMFIFVVWPLVLKVCARRKQQ